MRLLLLGALTACGTPKETGGFATVGGAEEPTTAPVTESETTTDEPACSTVLTDMRSNEIVTGWTSPTGRVYAASPGTLAVRDAAGIWTSERIHEEPTRPWALDGADDDTLWAVMGEFVMRRTPSGWVDANFPGNAQAASLHVAAEDDVTVFVPDQRGPNGGMSVHTWDGTTWRETETAPAPSSMQSLEVLSDGSWLFADVAHGHHYQEGAWNDVGIDVFATTFREAADGTLIGLGGDSLWVGPLGDLEEVRLDGTGALYDAWGESADDIWVVGEGPWPNDVVYHFDGDAWTEMATERGLKVVVPAPEGVAVLGGVGRRLAITGDATGLSVTTDDLSLTGVEDLALDTETGFAYAIGYDGLAIDEGSGWRAIEKPDTVRDASRVIASSGRVAVMESQGPITLFEADQFLSWEPQPDESLDVLTAAGGSLFALGSVTNQDRSYDPRAYVERGSGWEPIHDEGLPAGSTILSAWADGPDDLWAGLLVPFTPSDWGGALAHWDGSSWELVQPDLTSAPSWMARQTDGTLWMSIYSTLWIYDGEEVAIGPYVPGGMYRAHLFDDGTMYAWSTENGPSGLATTLQVQAPGGDWYVAQEAGFAQPMVGTGSRMWTATHEDETLTRICE